MLTKCSIHLPAFNIVCPAVWPSRCPRDLGAGLSLAAAGKRWGGLLPSAGDWGQQWAVLHCCRLAEAMGSCMRCYPALVSSSDGAPFWPQQPQKLMPMLATCYALHFSRARLVVR